MSNRDPILVVGGGLGGLTTALALARTGGVRVLEGAPAFGAIGYGIQFGPNVFHALARIGVADAMLAKADFPPALLMFDALTGHEVTRVPTGPSLRARFHYPYIVIHRVDLHNVAARCLPKRSAHHARARGHGVAVYGPWRPGHGDDR